MTVTSESSRADYTGNGVSTVYPYTFRIIAATDLEVTTVTTTGGETTLRYLTDYTVTGVGNRTGGSVVLTSALASGYGLTIRRVLDLLQPTSMRNQGAFIPENHEDAFDRNVMMIQQVAEENDRQMLMPVTTNPVNFSSVLPPPVANRVIVYNNNATALETATLDSSAVGVPGEGRTTTTATAFLANNATYSIHDYGAVGNGSDSTLSVQNALNAAGVTGGLVTAPPGTYQFTAALSIPPNVKLVGSGGLTTFNFTNTGTAYALLLSAANNSEVSWLNLTGAFSFGAYIASASNVRFTNNTVSGGTLVGPYGYLGGVHLNGCSNCWVENNYFLGNGLTGSAGADILINGPGGAPVSQNIHINDNACTSTAAWFNIVCFDIAACDIRGNYCNGAVGTVAYNNGYGIALYRSSIAQGLMKDNVVANNRITNCTGTGIYLQNSNSSAVVGNILWDVALSALDITLPISAIGLNNTQHATVVGNVITNSGKAGISIVDQNTVGAGTLACTAGAGTFSVSQATTLHNGDYILVGTTLYQVSGFNGTTSCTLSAAPTFGASTFTTTFLNGTVISANTVADCPNQIAIYVRGVNGVIVDANTVRNCYGGIGNSNGTNPYMDWTITNNKVSGTAVQGILALNVSTSKVNGNTVTGAGVHGIDMSVGGDGNEIAGNIIRDCGTVTPNTYSAITASCTNSAIFGNVLRNMSATVGTKYGITSIGAGCSVGPNVASGHLTASYNVSPGTSLTQFTQAVVLAGDPTGATQVRLGDTGRIGAVGTRSSGGDTYLVQNATESLAGVDLWTQSSASQSLLVILRNSGAFEFYKASSGTAPGTFAAFWGSPVHTIAITGAVAVGANQVVGPRNTGWTTMTGTATKAAAGFDTSSVTLPQLAQVVKALVDSSIGHGFNGA